MKFKAKQWIWTFFGTIGLAIFWEFYSLYDDNRATQPLTHYIVTYVSPWITLPFIVAGSIWLIHHFSYYYRKSSQRVPK